MTQFILLVSSELLVSIIVHLIYNLMIRNCAIGFVFECFFDENCEV